MPSHLLLQPLPFTSSTFLPPTPHRPSSSLQPPPPSQPNFGNLVFPVLTVKASCDVFHRQTGNQRCPQITSSCFYISLHALPTPPPPSNPISQCVYPFLPSYTSSVVGHDGSDPVFFVLLCSSFPLDHHVIAHFFKHLPLLLDLLSSTPPLFLLLLVVNINPFFLCFCLFEHI